ncbi:MAG: hypothetical protein ACXWB2_17180 [Acidimicrobiales bacterium]
MERWTFLIIADDGGAPSQIRILLRSGDQEAAWPSAQISLDGSEVAVDQVAHDYEAPEWKAVQVLDAGMGGGAELRMQQIKDGLRSRARV